MPAVVKLPLPSHSTSRSTPRMASSFRPPERKRANVFGDDGDLQPVQPKKSKPNTAHVPSFLPPPMPNLPPPPSLPPPPPPPSSALPNNAAAMIAAKRAEIQAKLAAMGALRPSAAAATAAPGARPSPAPPAQRLAVPGLPTPNLDPDLKDRVAEAKKMVEAMQARKKAQMTPVNPYLAHSNLNQKKDPVTYDPALAGRGGLSMAAHPLLMSQSSSSSTAASDQPTSKKDRYKPMTPKFSTTKANARMPPPPTSQPPPPPPPSSSSSDPSSSANGGAGPSEITATPYFDPRLSYGSAGVAGKSHMGKGPERSGFRFNQKGKFVRMGESLRAEMRMEELKKRILESARKAGLEGEMEREGRVLKRPAPPEVEWWDLPFLPPTSKSYSSFSESLPTLLSSGAITHYIQHPIPIPAPGEKNKVEQKALFLTKKEMKKMRRQRRAADLKDRQDRQKMGLLPPDPPKVKLNNMMRVLTQEAILDPTKIEAKVRRETVARAKGHDKMNSERKLTAEQRREKEEAKKEKDEKLGIQCLVFKIKYLANKLHKIKLTRNAAQNGLTGRIIHNPRFCLVVVEGGRKGIKFYKNLVENRIDWTEEPRDAVLTNPSDDSPRPEGGAGGENGVLGDVPDPVSLADNTCELVWNGFEKERMFAEFRNANCPSEASVKELLGAKLEGLWDLAKSEVKEEDD